MENHGVAADNVTHSNLLQERLRPRKRLKYIDMDLIQNTEATCPNCWETISLTLDLSEPEQSYIEDCPVCCKPMVVAFSSSDGELTALSVDAA